MATLCSTTHSVGDFARWAKIFGGFGCDGGLKKAIAIDKKTHSFLFLIGKIFSVPCRNH